MERKWWTLLAVCAATFMLLLDIAEELDASFSEVQWVIDAYALTLAALLLTAGSLADLLGRRLVFAVGLVCFTAASLLCALAPDATTLILARGVQGIGGAAMFATSIALLAQEFRGPERGTAFGLWGATTGAACWRSHVFGAATSSSSAPTALRQAIRATRHPSRQACPPPLPRGIGSASECRPAAGLRERHPRRIGAPQRGALDRSPGGAPAARAPAARARDMSRSRCFSRGPEARLRGASVARAAPAGCSRSSTASRRYQQC